MRDRTSEQKRKRPIANDQRFIQFAENRLRRTKRPSSRLIDPHFLKLLSKLLSEGYRVFLIGNPLTKMEILKPREHEILHRINDRLQAAPHPRLRGAGQPADNFWL
jgi:hypothetical protein